MLNLTLIHASSKDWGEGRVTETQTFRNSELFQETIQTTALGKEGGGGEFCPVSPSPVQLMLSAPDTLRCSENLALGWGELGEPWEKQSNLGQQDN